VSSGEKLDTVALRQQILELSAEYAAGCTVRAICAGREFGCGFRQGDEPADMRNLVDSALECG